MDHFPNDHRLRLFLEVASARSLRSVAMKLGVTQPALSKQIKALESRFSAPLFRRDGRGMDLTALGRQLFNAVGPHYDRIDVALEATAMAGGQRGRIAIATVNTLSAYLVPLAISRVKARYATLSIALTNASSPQIVESVEKGFSDIGLVYDTAVDSDAFTIHPLHTETLSGFRITKPKAAGALSREQLREESLILPPKTYALRRAFERELRHEPRIAIESNSVSLSLDLAACGLGIAILPHYLPEPMITTRGLERVQILDGKLRRPVVAITRRSAPLSEAQQYTLETMRLCARTFCAATVK